MTIESRLLVSIEHLKRTLFFVHSKTDSEHSKSFPHALKKENSTKFDEIHNIHDFGIPAQVDPMVNFQDENDKVKIGAKGQNGPIRTPRLVPCKLDYRKSKNTKNVNFHRSRKMDLWSTFPWGGFWFFEAIRPRSLTLVLKK